MVFQFETRRVRSTGLQPFLNQRPTDAFQGAVEPNHEICGRGLMGTRMPRPLQASCIPASRGIRVDFRLQPLPIGFLGDPKPATLLTCPVCLPVDWKHVRLAAPTWVLCTTVLTIQVTALHLWL